MQPGPQLTNLCRPLTSFVGRAADLGAIDGLLARERLLVVLGPPGVGKTRLAQEYALGRLGEFPGGAWFCDLTEARDRDSFLAAVGHALDLSLTTPAAAEQIGAALKIRGRLLLILDHLEHLVKH